MNPERALEERVRTLELALKNQQELFESVDDRLCILEGQTKAILSYLRSGVKGDYHLWENQNHLNHLQNQLRCRLTNLTHNYFVHKTNSEQQLAQVKDTLEEVVQVLAELPIDQ